MPGDFERPTRYRAAINLYVEDSVSLVYLKNLWNDPVITFFLGGGNEGVTTVIRIDREAGHPNVFGVVDRDYGPSNRDRWGSPDLRLFRLSVHEIENYLLEPQALASSRWNNVRLSAVRIDELMLEAARKRCWYEACRTVLEIIRSRFRDNFIGDPPQNVADMTAAQRHLCESAWFRSLNAHATRTTATNVADQLRDAHQRATEQLADGSWRREYSGKEVFKDIASRICDRQKLGGVRSSELYNDLAQAVAEWQLANEQIPTDLVTLRSLLHARIGLT